jgi:hypothetical protein
MIAVAPSRAFLVACCVVLWRVGYVSRATTSMWRFAGRLARGWWTCRKGCRSAPETTWADISSPTSPGQITPAVRWWHAASCNVFGVVLPRPLQIPTRPIQTHQLKESLQEAWAHLSDQSYPCVAAIAILWRPQPTCRINHPHVAAIAILWRPLNL